MILFRNGIRDPKHVIERVGPKFDIQIRTNKESTYSAADCSVSAFNRTILVGGVSASRMDSVVKFSEKITDIWISK